MPVYDEPPANHDEMQALDVYRQRYADQDNARIAFTLLNFGNNQRRTEQYAEARNSLKVALAMYRAQALTPEQNPAVYWRVAPIVERLAQRMNIPMPKLWLIQEDSPNAFATGRNPQHASVAFTTGILNVMSDAEIEGVVAHELGHDEDGERQPCGGIHHQ